MPPELRAVPVGARVAVIVIEPGVNGSVALEPAVAVVQAKMTSSIAVRLGVPVHSIVTTLFAEVIVDPDPNVVLTDPVVGVELQLPSDIPVGMPANVNSN